MRVHVTSLMPQSGTTRLSDLMRKGFAFDGYGNHELDITYAPRQVVPRFLSKQPGDLEFARWMVMRQRDLWLVVVIRDPRDVIVGRHRSMPDHYLSNLGVHHDRMKHYIAVRIHDRVTVVRYEDLVTDPDAVQARIEARIPWLERRASFSDLRPPETGAASGIGRWRSELPRIRAQIERHGGFGRLMGELGYDVGEDWPDVLDGVPADNGQDRLEDYPQTARRYQRVRLRRYSRLLAAIAGLPRQRDIILNG